MEQVHDAATLDRIVETLRRHEGEFADRGVVALHVFGSAARGQMHAGSDVDLLADFSGDARLTLIGLASLRARATDILGMPADVIPRPLLRPEVLSTAEQDAVRVF